MDLQTQSFLISSAEFFNILQTRPHIDDYLIIESMLAGGQGQVYKVQCHQKKFWAVKVYDQKEGIPFQQIQRIAAFAQHLRRLLPNFMAPQDVKREAEIYQLKEKMMVCQKHNIEVMRFMENKTLVNFMEKYGNKYRLEQSVMRKLFVDILNGVSVMWLNSIAHLDLKPTNILIGDSYNALISDLWTCANITQPQVVINGSRHWRDPLLLTESKSAYNAMKADIFSLGLILYFMYTGKTIMDIDADNMFKYYKDRPKFWKKMRENYQKNNINVVLTDSFIQLIDGMLDVEDRRWTLKNIINSAWYLNGEIAKSPEQIILKCQMNVPKIKIIKKAPKPKDLEHGKRSDMFLESGEIIVAYQYNYSKFIKHTEITSEDIVIQTIYEFEWVLTELKKQFKESPANILIPNALSRELLQYDFNQNQFVISCYNEGEECKVTVLLGVDQSDRFVLRLVPDDPDKIITIQLMNMIRDLCTGIALPHS